MPDDKNARDEQAHNEERRQREREMEEARDRGDEAEPVQDEPGEELGDLDDALESHEYPTTTSELVDEYGEYEVETQDGWRRVDEVFADTDDETYRSADDVRSRIQGLIHR